MSVTTIPNFNPSNDPRTAFIKRHVQEILDYIAGLNDDPNVDGRCLSIAATNFEQGAMWAVKALFVQSALRAMQEDPDLAKAKESLLNAINGAA